MHVLVPKIGTASDVEQSQIAIKESGAGTPALHAIIETPDALQALADIVTAGVASLVLGAFDLAKALNIEPDTDAAEILRARRLVADAAKHARAFPRLNESKFCCRGLGGLIR